MNTISEIAKDLPSIDEHLERVQTKKRNSTIPENFLDLFSPSQNQAYDLCTKNTDKNVLIKGIAGSGKSFLLRTLVKHFEDENISFAVLAPTGVAAINIEGRTIHSFFGFIPTSGGLVTRQAPKPYVQQRIAQTEILIIDEVSVVGAALLEAMEERCRRYGSNGMFFGGKRLIFFGDFEQLPPVKDSILTISPVWKELNVQTVYLTTSFRQTDDKLLEILNHIRGDKGQIDQTINSIRVIDKSYTGLTSMMKNRLMLRNRERLDKDIESGSIKREELIYLFATNEQRDIHNDRKLEELSGKVKVYEMKGDKNMMTNSVVETNLTLKVGARVMLLMNTTEHGPYLCNGDLGMVVSFSDNDLPVVRFDRFPSSEFVIDYHTWFDDTEETNMEDVIEKPTTQRVMKFCSQVPLTCAWAITVHKSQGLTFDKLVIDCKNMFAAGQFYVALSRGRSLKSIYLLNFDVRAIKPVGEKEYEPLEERTKRVKKK